jgi:hypothetical protein
MPYHRAAGINQMVQSRRLILHIGAPKTGTSAIQRFLASNIENLRLIGMDYLNAEPPRADFHTTGNGLPIFLYFERAEVGPKKLESLVNGYFGAQRTAIVSSELLSSIAAVGWRHIIDACQAQNITPFVIYYVRNVYPFYISTYNQAVKHDGVTESFEEFVERNSVFNCADRLTFITELIGANCLNVAHYESEQKNICEHFFSLISPTAHKSSFELHAARVNRSLDEAELRLMRIANQYPKAQFPGELSNILISSDPNRCSEKPSRPEIIQLLTTRHIHDVSQINTRYFECRDTLKIGGPVPTSLEDTTLATAPAEKLFEWAMARLDSTRHENFQQFLDEARALAARSRKVIHPDIPPDFDPAAYLLANPDLLMARVNPYKHFLNHGHAEGRSWRIDGDQCPARTRTSELLKSLIKSIWSVSRLPKSVKTAERTQRRSLCRPISPAKSVPNGRRPWRWRSYTRSRKRAAAGSGLRSS